jgi:hypothetical protein
MNSLGAWRLEGGDRRAGPALHARSDCPASSSSLPQSRTTGRARRHEPSPSRFCSVSAESKSSTGVDEAAEETARQWRRPGAGASSRAFEPPLQPVEVGGHLLLRASAHHQRDQHLPDPVAGEVQPDRDPRSFAVVERCDGDLDSGPDRAIDAANAPRLGRIDVRDHRRDRSFGTANPARREALVAEGVGLVALHMATDDTLLLFPKAGCVSDVREHLLWRSRDLGGG